MYICECSHIYIYMYIYVYVYIRIHVYTGDVRGCATALREGWNLIDEMCRDSIPLTLTHFERLLAIIGLSSVSERERERESNEI